MSLQATTWQTVGPYFRIGLQWLNQENSPPKESPENASLFKVAFSMAMAFPFPMRCWSSGRPMRAASTRIRRTPNRNSRAWIHGYGRVPSNGEGIFRLPQSSPVPSPGPDRIGQDQAPHILVSVFMRGLLTRLITRIYFPDEPRNATDYVLNLVEPDRRSTLIAKPVSGHLGALEWNVALQGPNETVFFELGS